MNLEMMKMWADSNRQQYEYDQFRKQLANQKEHEERLLRMVEDGLITRDEWREMMGMKILKGNAEIDRLEHQLKNMRDEEISNIPKVLNCPNCGAPITGDKCEYCGTVFRRRAKPEKKQIIADGVIYYDYDPGGTCKLYADNECIMEIRKEDLL